MTGAILGIITRLTLFATGIAACFASSGINAAKLRDRRSPVFVQTPQSIHYNVTRNQSVNLTWVAKNICKIQIKCNERKFRDGLTRVCGKSCRRCRTRKKTKIVRVADFPQDTRSISCQCKVWGKIAVRSDKIIIEKSFLRRNFGTVQSYHAVALNMTVTLQCRPPYGTPRPNITWYKMGQPSPLLGSGGRVRLRSKKDLIIERVRMSDSGEYWCVAMNMAARRVGPVMKLDVRENISIPVCNESQWPCNSEPEPACQNESNTSTCEPPMLMVGTHDGLYTTDLLNTSKWRHIIEANNIVSLDFGVHPNLIYWSDGETINRFSMHNGVSKDMPFRHDDGSSVEGLAVDWIGDKLYWIDAMHVGIYVGDLRSGRKVKIIENNLDSPRAIVVSHSESYIYWTDWGRTPKIERARLDGTERKVLIDNGIQFPNGLALDETEKKLYWAGADTNGYGIIEAVSLDGLNRTVIFYCSGYHPFSLDIFQGFVYWTDWEKKAVLRVNKTEGGREEVIVSGLNQPMGLKILRQRKEKKGINPCDKGNGECDHLCLHLTFLGRRRCFCAENFKLNENGKTCDKLELRGESRNKSSPNSSTDPSLVVILLVFILLPVVLGLVILLIKKRCPCQMTRDQPRTARPATDPDDIEDDGDTDQTELGRTVQHLNSESAEPSNLIGQDSSEPSGSAAACEDSLVASPRGLVVYVTKVEVEQHGGVTVVGDDAKIHHHYSPQS